MDYLDINVLLIIIKPIIKIYLYFIWSEALTGQLVL